MNKDELGKLFYNYQKAFLKDQSQFRINLKARQIGFSWLIAFEGAVTAIESKTSIYISTGLRASYKLLDQARTWVVGLTEGSRKYGIPLFRKDSSSELELVTGGKIISLPPSEITAVGYTGDDLYFDEAARIKELAKLLKAVSPSLTRQDKKRRLTLNSAPFGKQGLFYDICTNKDNRYSYYQRHKTDIYTAIADGFPADIKACLSLLGAIDENDPAFKQEYCCEFIDEATSFFPFELIEPCINYDLEDRAVPATSNNPQYAGYDPAKEVDSGVFTVIEKTPIKVTVNHINEWKKVSYREQLAAIQVYNKSAKVTKLAVDKTGVGGKIEEDLTNSLGAMVEGITFTNPVKEKLITNLRQLFQDRKIEIPNNAILIHQLHSLQREQGDVTIRYRHEQGEHDDYVWSLALACYMAGSQPTIRPMVAQTGGVRI